MSLPTSRNVTLNVQHNYLVQVEFNSFPSQLNFHGSHNELSTVRFIITLRNILLNADLRYNKINSWSALVQSRLSPNSTLNLKHNFLVCDELILCDLDKQGIKVSLSKCAECRDQTSTTNEARQLTHTRDITPTTPNYKNTYLIATGPEDTETRWDLFDF